MSDVKVAITGDNAGLIAALTEAKAAVAEASESMAAAMERVKGAFEGIQSAMLAVTAVLAGGEAFGEAISASVNAAKGAQQLGRELGITATQASILKVAMDENFVSSEAVSSASNKIATTLKKNENAFVELGIATRDANGNFRNSFDIMQDVNAKLLTFKEGTDRNVEGQKIYGKSWVTVSETLRLAGDAMEEAKTKADALGLTVGKEGIAQANDYRKAMAGVHTVFDALEKVIGDALVPVLTSLAQWFENVGPQAVAIMRAAVYSVYAAFSYLKEGVTIVVDAIAGQVDILGAEITRFANTADRALHFDFSGAKAAWVQGTADIAAKSKFMSDQIVADMKAASDARDKFFEKQDAQQTPTDDKTGEASTGGDGKAKSMLAALETALEQRKAALQAEWAAEGSMREFGKADELDYWNSVIETTRAGSADRLAIEKKIATDEVAIQRQTTQGALAELKARADEQKDNVQLRLSLEYEYAAKVMQAYGADSKEYAEAQKAIVETKRQTIDQLRQADEIRSQTARTAALNEIQVEQDAAKLKYDNGRLSLDQYIALEQQFEAQKYAIKRQELQKELDLEALGPDNPVKMAQLDGQLEALETQHTAALYKIQQLQVSQSTALYKTFTDSLGRSFSTAFQGIINGTQTMGQAFRGIFTSMLSTITQFFAQWAAKALAQHLIAMIQNKQEAASNAAVAATGAGKSAAQIPYIGWALAIGAMASVFGAASGYSAAGGFDVPAGLNPMTQLHSNEMVLPAPLADRVRNMTAGAANPMGDDSGGGAPVNVNFPGKDLGNHFLMHKDDLQVAIKTLIRNGNLGG